MGFQYLKEKPRYMKGEIQNYISVYNRFGEDIWTNIIQTIKLDGRFLEIGLDNIYFMYSVYVMFKIV